MIYCIFIAENLRKGFHLECHINEWLKKIDKVEIVFSLKKKILLSHVFFHLNYNKTLLNKITQPCFNDNFQNSPTVLNFILLKDYQIPMNNYHFYDFPVILKFETLWKPTFSYFGHALKLKIPECIPNLLFWKSEKLM